MSTVSVKKPSKKSTVAKKAAVKSGVSKPKTKAAVTKTAPPVAPTPLAAVAAVPENQAKPNVVEPMVAGLELRKKELFDLVTDRSGLKKKDVKPVVEAMLAVLGEAVAENREMILHPMGKVMIQRTKEVNGGRVSILKLRQKNAPISVAADFDPQV